MNLFARWGRFNLVGIIGSAVQLGSLAVLNRCLPGHYLAASATALEITLLHNFLWHCHYTWRDRQQHASRLSMWARYQLSSGLISMFSNLACMRLLVHTAHVPILPANAIAILACSLVNFYAGNSWAFRADNRITPRTHETARETSNRCKHWQV